MSFFLGAGGGAFDPDASSVLREKKIDEKKSQNVCYFFVYPFVSFIC